MGVRTREGGMMLEAAVMINGTGYRYAQEKAGQQLHLVEIMGDGVAPRARCGRQPERWRVTFNVPWAHECRNCRRTVTG